ncbi:hypothetical protein [Streptosporangium sp. NPDC048865]|uniref:hypothetical protein n=1 Tax=Streptosporangium sp. NPDC048865 TaxID=3155766 RepID=UPI00343F9B69
MYTLPCAPNGTNAHQMWEPLLQYRDGVNPDIVVLRNDATGRCLARINSTGELRTIVECDDNDGYATVEWYAQGASWRRVVFSHWYGNTSYAVDSNFTGGAYAQAWNGGLHQQWNFKSRSGCGATPAPRRPSPGTARARSPPVSAPQAPR